MNRRGLHALSGPILFLLFFSYATAAALLFQKFLLPLVTSAYHGHGLLAADSAYFHSVAVELAEKIRQNGWSAWRIYPAKGAAGNVALLGALYRLFGSDPSLIVPVNAAFHALSGTLLFLLGRTLWPGKIGVVAGTVTGTLFVVFPSALNWYGQIHKDGFAIAGAFLILMAWTVAGTSQISLKRITKLVVLALAGAGLSVFVRPYNLTLIFGGLAAMLVVQGIVLCSVQNRSGDARSLIPRLLLVVLVGVMASMAPRAGVESQNYAHWSPDASKQNRAHRPVRAGDQQKLIESTWSWQHAFWVPRSADKYAEVLARTRFGLIRRGEGVQADSIYDADALPQSTPQVLEYIPRALQIAVLAPFPSHWFEKLSAARLVAIGEMAICYAIIPGLFLALWFARSREALFVVVFALSILAVYGVTLANVGTLYRIRYPFLFLLLLVGVAGWMGFFERRGWLSKNAPNEAVREKVDRSPDDLTRARSTLVSSGVAVAAVTAMMFFGLFVRDVIMARLFGLGVELDAFVAASIVPMFLVVALSVPIGTAIVPVYLNVQAHRSPVVARALAQRIGLAFLAVALVLSVLLLVIGPHLLEIAGWESLADKAALTQAMMVWMVAIFFISGLVTLANGLLNALGQYMVPAAAQMTVPVFAIGALLLFGSSHGAIVVAVAMLAGQVANLVIVYLVLARHGMVIWNFDGFEKGKTAEAQQFIAQYLPLIAAAVFMQLALPVSTGMASVLPEGSVAALGLGNKAVLFATGLIGAAVTSVVLPYFSRYLSQNRWLDAKRELSFLLLMGTVISIPFTLSLYLLSEPFVRLVFEGGALGSADAEIVSHVMAYGVLQLPFFVINILLLKFAIASRHSARVMLAAGLGLAAVVLLNLALMNRMGVSGIALSMTMAVAITSAVMLVLFWRLGDVTWMDTAFIGMNWMLFLALAVCLHYESYSGVIAAGSAFVFLAFGEWSVVARSRAYGTALP